MSTTAVCSCTAATAATSLSVRKLEVRQQGSVLAAHNLVPAVSLVNRSHGQDRSFRWQQRSLKQSGKAASDIRQRWRAQSSRTMKAISVDESKFETEVLKSPIPVLVDFWAAWCGPCRLMGITLDWAAQEYDGKIKCVKIETDSNQGLVDKYKVYGLPTLMLFVNGEIIPNTQREGALNKEKLQMYLEKNLPALAPTS